MGFFSKTLDKLKGALKKTAAVLNTDVRTLFVPGRQIDDAFLAEMEEKFIRADMGVKNVTHIVARSARALAAGQDQERRPMPKAIVKQADARRLGPAEDASCNSPQRADGHPRRRHQRRGQDHQHRQARLAAEERR